MEVLDVRIVRGPSGDLSWTSCAGWVLLSCYFLFDTCYSLRFIRYSLLLTCNSLLYFSFVTTYSLLITSYSLFLFVSFYYVLVKLWKLSDVKNFNIS